MEPTIHTKNIKLTPRIENYVTKKTERLDRYMSNVAELRIDLSSQRAKNANERRIAQITVRDARGTILRAEEHHNDIFAAIDMVVDKMYRQIQRYRGKKKRLRRAGPSIDTIEDLLPLPIDEADDDMDGAEGGPRIVRHKRFPMHPMSPDEAIEQMELLGHDFYVFFNSDEEAINVAYKRKGDDYGLLQPELE